MQGNPTDILLNWETPFDDQKIVILDQVVAAMYQKNPQDVSDLHARKHCVLCSDLCTEKALARYSLFFWSKPGT